MMEYLSFFVVILVFPAVFGGLEQCPGNLPRNSFLRLFESNCYEFVLSHPVDWSHADKDCKLKGGYLVDIHSSAENYFIYKTLRELGYLTDEGVWIGLSDQVRESHWYWTHTGVPLDYKNWGSGQPGLAGFLEDCAVLQVADGKWHDYQCSGFLFSTEKHGWVCKYDASPVFTSSKPIVDGGFPNMMTTEVAAMATGSAMISQMPPQATDGMDNGMETESFIPGGVEFLG